MLQKLAKFALVSGVCATAVFAHGQSVNIVSGSADTYDAYGPDIDSDYSTPVGPILSAASSGPNAYVITPNSNWAQNILGSSAVWIGDTSDAGTDYGYSAMYAANFTWSGPAYAILHLTFAADDSLGYYNPGLFLDGSALAGSTDLGTYGHVSTYNAYLGPLSDGAHTLYFNDVNWGGGPAGLLFDATVTTPSPGAYAAFGFGALGLIVRRRPRKK